ncbi:MAG TPA: DUF5683 domain-containing protein [Ignavibacteriaceae bacterium]|nr:DUF5683 domain-containing protein [Ignavibacteriaceae bacterium]
MKSLIKNITKILVTVVLINIPLIAQQDTTAAADTINNSTNNFVMQKSPWGAVLRSAIIPGWGQIYNESYWKVPIVWGITGWLVYVWVDNNNLYKDNRTLFLQTGDDRYKRFRDFYRDQRDQFAIYIVLTYFLNLVDAYVDAHLFDFNVDENYFTGQKMYNLRINF